MILAHAEAMVVEGAERVLRRGVALLGEREPLLVGAAEIACLIGGHTGLVVGPDGGRLHQGCSEYRADKQ